MEGGWALDAAAALDELEARGLIDAAGYRDIPNEKLTCAQAAEHIFKTATDHFGLDYREPVINNFAVTRVTVCPSMLFEMTLCTTSTIANGCCSRIRWTAYIPAFFLAKNPFPC